MNSLRVIESGAGTPTDNMALDEGLLEEAEDLVLRLYQWEPHAVSLGYFQRPDSELLAELEAEGIPSVRRMTGGGAILHADELTYALAGPESSLPFDGGVENSYRFVHDCIIEVLRNLWREHGGDPNSGPEFEIGYASSSPPALSHRDQPFLCFARSTALDLVARGKKLVGSAKRRRGGRALQHGSILLAPHSRQGGAITLSELFPTAPSPADLGRRLAFQIAKNLGLSPHFEGLK